MSTQTFPHPEAVPAPSAGYRYQDLDLFRGVSLDAIEHLFENCFEARYRRGEVVLRAGGENRFIYLVLAGRLAVSLAGRSESPLVELGPGACAGEMSILSHVDVSAHVHAVEDSVLLVIDQETLWSMIDASHGVARNLLYILSGRVRQGNERLAESAESLRRFEHFASVDALTGLHNRRWLDDVLERELERCRQDGIPLAAVMLDVDRFKQLNDTWGHGAGDEVLQVMAGVLHRHLRPVDMAARYGGEEFVVLMHGVGADGAFRIAERLRQDIASTPISCDPEKGLVVRITVSMGVAVSGPGDTGAALLARADAALYRAKEGGRDRVER